MEQKKASSIANSYRFISAVALAVLIVGMIFYHFVEKLTWIDAFYFCVVTMATIGYGDITPKTEMGKIFTAFYILVGVGILGAFINSLTSRAKERRERKLNS